jgi:hypothetical protein
MGEKLQHIFSVWLIIVAIWCSLLLTLVVFGVPIALVLDLVGVF